MTVAVNLNRQAAAEALLHSLDATELSAPLEPARQVFTNRNLPLDQVSLVGFDMDYTLAIYKRLPMEELQYDLTMGKLIAKRGYPQVITRLPYDPAFVIRGLVVDKARGNILKMDSHGVVGRVFHGRTSLAPEVRREVYRNTPVRLSSTRRFASLDTLFSMPETCLYSNLVDFFEGRVSRGESGDPLQITAPSMEHLREVLAGTEVHPRVDEPETPINYFKLFDDVRDCIDEAHRDDSLKSIIKKDLGTYIFKDPELALTLHKMRSSGKKLFLLTNSHWDYTQHVMTFLLEGQIQEYPSWRHFFDVVVVGASKPRFFTENNPFLEVDPLTGETRPVVRQDRFERGHVYQGGNIRDFEKRLGLNGDQILYVGDHIYGDILRSKKNNMWRTAMVVQELEEEINVLETHRARLWALTDLDKKRFELDAAISQRKTLLSRLEHEPVMNKPDAPPEVIESAIRLLRKKLDQDKRELRMVAAQAERIEAEVETALNPYWGMVFKEAHELSRFGEQVEEYACIYTSRVSNLLYYSPMHFFRAMRTQMHHERVALAGERKTL